MQVIIDFILFFGFATAVGFCGYYKNQLKRERLQTVLLLSAFKKAIDKLKEKEKESKGEQ